MAFSSLEYDSDISFTKGKSFIVLKERIGLVLFIGRKRDVGRRGCLQRVWRCRRAFSSLLSALRPAGAVMEILRECTVTWCQANQREAKGERAHLVL